MKKYIYLAVAAIAALSSCSSDNDPIMGETGKQALTFTASMEGSATRATYNDTEKCASWEEGDQISINGKTYNAQSAGLTTTFKAATEGQEAEGPTYNAYFACTYDGSTATLPAEVSETWANGKFNMPMYATSTTTDLAFKNLCGVLKIIVKSDQIAAVKKIKVSSANKAVSGAFTVTSDAAVLSEPNTVANTLTVTYADAVSTTAEGKVFYVAVPAQTYQELKIELDADGNGFTKSMTTKSATDITVDRNKIYPITFNATPTQYDVTFDSFSIDGTTVTASNGDVTVALTLSAAEGEQPGSWRENRGALRFSLWEGTMGINVEPNDGVTVNGIVYTGSSSTTKTGTGPWNFTVTNGVPWDGSLRLGGELNSVTVTYTK